MNDSGKASEAYKEIINGPDKDAKIKMITEEFEQFKKQKTSADHEKAVSTKLDLAQKAFKELYISHRLHVVMYGAYEDPLYQKGPFTFTNSGK